METKKEFRYYVMVQLDNNPKCLYGCVVILKNPVTRFDDVAIMHKLVVSELRTSRTWGPRVEDMAIVILSWMPLFGEEDYYPGCGCEAGEAVNGVREAQGESRLPGPESTEKNLWRQAWETLWRKFSTDAKEKTCERCSPREIETAINALPTMQTIAVLAGLGHTTHWNEMSEKGVSKLNFQRMWECLRKVVINGHAGLMGVTDEKSVQRANLYYFIKNEIDSIEDCERQRTSGTSASQMDINKEGIPKEHAEDPHVQMWRILKNRVENIVKQNYHPLQARQWLDYDDAKTILEFMESLEAQAKVGVK